MAKLLVPVFFLFESNITIYGNEHIHNVLIVLDIPMTLKMADEVWNGSKPGIAISA